MDDSNHDHDVDDNYHYDEDQDVDEDEDQDDDAGRGGGGGGGGPGLPGRLFQNNRYYGDGHGKRDVDDVSELQRGRCAVVSSNNMMDAVDSRDNFQDNHVSRKAAMDMQ